MPEPNEGSALSTSRPGAPTRVGRTAARVLLALGKRVYALALIALVLWLSWRAFRYLLAALIFPAPPPPQIVEIPKRMEVTLLSPAGFSFAGLAATDNPRTPLAHYHRLGAWFQPDASNDCTRSGCHVPLPHGRNKADRAFLNLHATSIHCGVCHMQTEQKPLHLTWYDLQTGARTDTPALLKTYAWLVAPRARNAAGLRAADQREIVALLHTAARQAGGEPVLIHLADHLAAVRAGSDEFAQLLDTARATVPGHFRGEYGAKLALLEEPTKQPRLRQPGSAAAAGEYLARAASLDEAERQALLTKVHPLRRKPTLNCTDCHTPQGGLVDLAAVGYPQARIEALVQPLVMQAIEHIVQGREFHMPGFIAPPDRSMTRPSQPPEKP